MPRSLSSQLLITYLLLMLLAVGGLIVWMGMQLQSEAIDDAEHNLELQAFLVANSLKAPLGKLDGGQLTDPAAIRDLVRANAARLQARILLVDNQFSVLSSSDDTVPLKAIENRIELVAARDGTEQHDVRFDEWSREERLFAAVPIVEAGGAMPALVQLSVPMAPLRAEIFATWLSLLGAGGVVLALTAAVSLFLARGLTRPLRRLTAVTEAMAAGDLDRRVTPEGPEQIARLGVAFNRMADRVRDLLARQREFVSHAAHELRSPLTSIRLRLEMLQTHARSDPALGARYLAEIDGLAGQMQGMVEQLLTLASLDEGANRPLSALDPAPLLYALVDQLAPAARRAGIELLREVPDHLPAVRANADLVSMAVRNLLDNALRYTPEGGRVALVAERNGSSLKIVVSDTGIGIPAEALAHIFERFYRADASRSRAIGGAGLGLALVRSIVDLHGGSVSVQSEPGRGSRFTLTFPLAD